MITLIDNETAWSLSFDDFEFLAEHPERTRLDLAVKVLAYRTFGQFVPFSQIDQSILFHVGNQLSLRPSAIVAPKYVLRTDERRRGVVRAYLALSEASVDALRDLSDEISANPNLATLSSDDLRALVLKMAVDKGLLPPPTKWIDRMHETLRNKVDEAIFLSLTDGMSRDTQRQLQASLDAAPGFMSLPMIRDTAGAATRDTFDIMAARVSFIRDLDLPPLRIDKLDSDWKDSVVRRVDKLKPAEIRRMRKAQRLGMYCIYLGDKQAAFTDALIETLINAVAKMQRTKEANVAKSIGKRSRQIYSREQLLQKIVAAALSSPDRPVGDVVFELIDQDAARAILGSASSKNSWAQDVFALMRSSWSTYYRSMLRTMLETVEFESSNVRHRPFMEALDWIRVNYKSKGPHRLAGEGLSIEGVIPNKYRSAVVDQNGFIDRHAYELCAVLTLREALRSREI